MTNQDLIDLTRSTIRQFEEQLETLQSHLVQKCGKIEDLPESEYEEAQGELEELEVSQNRCGVIIAACQA